MELIVEGMSCGHCVRAVTRAVESLDPGAKVEVDLGTGRVRVEGTPSEAAVRGAIEAAGYRVLGGTGD